jgi:hypothetical protein
MALTQETTTWESWYWGKGWSELVGKAWADPAFKKRLLSDPAAALKEQGVAVPRGVQIHVHENTEKALNLTLPAKPSSEELAEEELLSVAAGSSWTKIGGIRQ